MPGEFTLIERFVRCFDVDAAPRGPGDDCAIVAPSRFASCVTTDTLVEDVHFTRRGFSFEDIGHKALAVNLSDLAAMGARADWFTVALTLPREVQSFHVVALGRGMSKLARVHGARLIGGNFSSGAEISITITASGILDGKKPLLRSNARVGDRIFVSGTLGSSAGGLLPNAPTALLRAQRRPHPHLEFARLARAFINAAIDVSDGLLQDLGHITRASGVGAELDSERIPLSGALLDFAGPQQALTLATTGGEDYVLLFTAPARHAERLRALGAFEIGHIVRGSGVRLDGKAITGRTGFTHR
ncbi:MAG: thiamine-phosphate kinase [Archangium sp.]